MTQPAYSSFSRWYRDGQQASYMRAIRSPGGIVDLLEVERPAGDMSRPALPDLVLCQDLRGGSRTHGDSGGGRFDVTSEKGAFFLSAPNFTNTSVIDDRHRLRGLVLPLAKWQSVLDETANGAVSMEWPHLYRGHFHSPAIRSAFRNLWSLCEDEGAPSRLLARAAGCEILAELSRLGGAPFRSAKGGLAPWAERRSLDLMHARFSEDISLDELAAEARLSPFHFSRMFKESLGVPPRVYLRRLRVEKACELLERTNLPITEIALEVGYSSNQVLARVFLKHMRVSPTDYRRAVRDPVRKTFLNERGVVPTASEEKK